MVTLARQGFPSWYSDLLHMFHDLPVPVSFCHRRPLTLQYVDECLAATSAAMLTYVHRLTMTERTPLLHYRPLDDACKWRDHLRVADPEHRRSLSRLLLADHPLAIEAARRLGLPRSLRKCRFCLYSAIENEWHVLFHCRGDPVLNILQQNFVHSLAEIRNPITNLHSAVFTDKEKWIRLMSNKFAMPALAQFVDAVFTLCNEVPWNPA
ncbi:hypothetical protein C8Q75DRAFT_328231 [Abortiporus biennis]|nr:hypothetical protein C8Q75DRAFT_328231 [Abortiporus biennis]